MRFAVKPCAYIGCLSQFFLQWLSLAHWTQALVLSAAECGIRYPVMRLVHLSRAPILAWSKVGKVEHFALPASLLVDDTNAYIFPEL